MKLILIPVAVLCCFVSMCMCDVEHMDHGAGSHKSKHFKHHGEEHSETFDSEALIGSHDDIEELAELPTDVRIRRLRILAKAHDENNNNIIEKSELKEWVVQSFRMLDAEEADKKFKEEDENEDGKVSWLEILHKNWGYTEEEFAEMEKHPHSDDDESVDQVKLVHEDKVKFSTADVNKDGLLDAGEFTAFHQPYEHMHMVEGEMTHQMSEIDKNKNGLVDVTEFLAAFEDLDEQGKKDESEYFGKLDLNKDGNLDKKELRPYLVPNNEEVADQEVDHLIETADVNKDNVLTIDEIVAKEDDFVNSAATDYGRSLHYIREEL